MVKFVARTRTLLALLAGAVILAAAHSADTLSASDRTIAALTADTAVADVNDLMLDLATFRGMVLRGALGADAGAIAGLRGHFDALRNELSQFEARHTDGIADDPTAVAALLALDQAVVELDPLVRDAGGREYSARIGEIAQGMEGGLGKVAAVTSTYLGRSLATAGIARAEAYQQFLWFAGGLVIAATLLVSGLLRANQRLNRLARRDALTALPNRLTFTETLSAVMKDPGPGNEVALMLIDVDLFKDVNDTLGHAAGDVILKGIAKRLATLAGRDLRVARLGGDEFAIIVTSHQAHRAAADTVARMTKLLDQPFDVAGKTIPISLSIGIAITPLDWCDAETMLRNADVALYASKAAGRGTFRIFNPRMDRDTRERREMADDLRAAVAARGLDLHFQPIVDLATRQVVSCEALARWTRVGHGPVPPMTFIALAEEIGLIQDIGDWVLEEACRVARTWPDHVGVSINLSPHQFDQSRLLATLVRVLADTGIRPSRIELEITESLLLRDTVAVQNALKDLRHLGVQIALDDFGTGYSCLSYLQRFPIDRIKIDQSFVREMTCSPEATVIVESICLLAAKLRIATTGEGIETEAHAALLDSLGCRSGQGYLFAKPMPAEACAARLAGRQAIADAA